MVRTVVEVEGTVGIGSRVGAGWIGEAGSGTLTGAVTVGVVPIGNGANTGCGLVPSK